MANENIKFKTGALSNLPSTYTAGQVLFAIDENNIGYIYFDKNNSTRILMSSNAQYAEKANKDASNQIITATYLKNIKGAKNSGETTYDLTGISGSGGDVTTTASVPITLVSSSNKTGTKLYLLGATSQTTKGVAGYSNSSVFINTSNQLEATSGFKGNLTGTASSASSVAWSGITGVPANVTNIANWKGSVFSVIGTQTSTTGAWTGRLDAIQDVSGLYDGLTIMYYLPRTGSGNATLNLTFANGSNTGAIPVYWTGTSRATTHYAAGSTIRLTYWSAGSISVNGTATTEARWTAADYDSNSDTIPSAYCGTAAATAAKTASCTQYSLTDNTYTHVLIRYANTSAGAITLNINSKGAKPIYINGEASSATNYTLPAGTYIAYYDGTAYQFRTDGILPGSILYANDAGSATNDSQGQAINTTYIKNLTCSGVTLTYTKGNGATTDVSIAALPTAGGTMTGAIKRYYSAASTDPMISMSSNDKDAILFQVGHNTSVTPSTSNYYKLMYKGTGSSPNNLLQLIAAKNTSSEVIAIKVDENGNVTFTNTVTANISGSANSATYDSANQQITTTYIKGLSVSGTTLTITKGSGSTSTLNLQDFDVKVNMVQRGTTKAYLLGTTTEPTSTAQAVTSVAETGVYFDTTAAVLVATKFKGSLEGNADTATSATYDSNNQEIYKTYIKSLSVSGRTITYTKGDGSTGTITTQDNNTDTKVNTKLATTTKAYLLATSTTPTSSNQAVESVADTGVYLDTTAGMLTATTFKGALQGNADTATKATKDSDNQQITTTYIKGLSLDGLTLTITKGNGGTSTLTLQDLDVKMNVKARGTTKAYLLGTTTSPTSSDQAVTGVAETGVYFDTTAAKLVATTFKGSLEGNADTATKATKDSANQQINSTYIKGLSASSVTITVTKGDGSTSTFDIGALPLSGGTMTGNILAGGTQSLGSTSNPFHNLVLGGATNATMTNESTNPRITFQENTGTQPVHLIYTDQDSYRNPAGLKVVGGTSATPAWFEVEGNVYAAAFKGNADSATKATQDSAGQQINTTYIKGLSISGTTLTITKGSGSTSTITLQDFDVKVNMKARGTTKAYLLGTTTSPTSTNQAITSVAETGVYFDTTAAKLVATTFKGALEGNADTATKATQDSAGQQINTTYIKNASVNQNTAVWTFTRGSGATFTVDNSNYPTQKLLRPAQLNGLNDATLQSLVSSARANRLAFLPPDQIIIEQTTDGGATWVDAGISDTTKQVLFSETHSSVSIPLLNGVRNANCGLRITFTAMKYNVPEGTAETAKYGYWNAANVKSYERYTQLKEFYFWLNAVNDGIAVKVERATGANSNNWVTVFDNTSWAMTGWSGCDYVRIAQSSFGGDTTQTGNYWNYRMTFFTRNSQGASSPLATSYTGGAQGILEIRGYGDTAWVTSNNYMARDHLYSWDYNLNAAFPANVRAVKFIGPLEGNADTATTATKALQDNKGQQIDTTYIKNIVIDETNHKLTFTNGSGGNTELSLGFVKLTGDTMTDSLYISAANTGDRFAEAGNSNGKVRLLASANRGLYDATKSNWIIYRNQAGTTTYVVNNNYAWTYTSDGKFDAPGEPGENADLIGTASRAIGDQKGQAIVSYVRNISISGTTITITKGNGSTSTLTTQDTNTDTKVNVALNTTTKAYLLATTTTPTSTDQGVTAIADTGVYLDTTAGALTATTFKGNLAWSYLTSVPQIVEGALGSVLSSDKTKYRIQLKNLSGSDIASSSAATNGVIDVPIDQVGSSNKTGTKLYIIGTTAQSADAATGYSNSNIYITTGNKIHGNLEGKADTAGAADTATKATQDASGNVITSNYAASLTGTANSDKYTLVLKAKNNGDLSTVNIPAATTDTIGLVTTAAQTFAGAKTFTGTIQRYYGSASTEPMISLVSNNLDAIALQMGHGTAAGVATQNYYKIVYNGAGSQPNNLFKLIAAKTTDTEVVAMSVNEEGNVTFTNTVAASISGTAARATADANGDNIRSTYLKNLKGTTSTTTYKIVGVAGNGNDVTTTAEVPAATSSIAGLVTTGTQTMAGAKTFSTSISTPQLTVTGASKFEYSGIQAGSDNADRVVWFAYNGKNGIPVYDNDFKYNPATNKLTVSNIAGSAITLSSGNDSTHSTEDATLKVTGGVSVSLRLSAKMIRVDNGNTDTTKGFNLVYDSTNECLKFQFGN